MGDSDNAIEIRKRGAQILKRMEELSERMPNEISVGKGLTLSIEYFELTALLLDDEFYVMGSAQRIKNQ